MSKRILSLVLAVCMLLLSVPVFVLSVFADGSALPKVPYTIKFNGTAPDNRVNTPTIQDSTVVWPSAWSMGKMKDATHFDMYEHYSTAGNGIACYSGDDMWSNGGVYLTDFSGKQVSMITPDAIKDSLHFAAPYTGTLTLDVKQLMNTVANNALAIFHNGTMIWPVAETAGETANFADTSKWFAMTEAATYNYGTSNEESVVTSPLKLENISVKIGDKIDIAVARLAAATGDGHSLHDLIVDATYTAVQEDVPTGPVYVTNFSGVKHFPGLVNEATWTVKENLFANNDGWDLVSYALDHTDLKICNTIVNAAATESQGDGFWGCGDGLWNPGTTVFRMVGNDNWGATGSVSNAEDRMGGVRYTADRTGVADIIIDDIVSLEASEVAVFINGTKVFPAGDAWLSVGKTSINSENTDTSVLNDLFLKAGDTIEFLARNTMKDDTTRNGLWAGRATSLFYTVSFDKVLQAPTYTVEADGDNLKVTVAEAGNLTDMVVKFGVDSVLGANGEPVMKAYTDAEGVYTIPAKNATKLLYSVTGNLGETAVTANGEVALAGGLVFTFTAPTVDFDNDGAITYNGGWDFVTYENATQIGKGALAMSAWSIEGAKWPYAVISKTRVTADIADAVAGVTMWHQPDWGGNNETDYRTKTPAMSLRARGGNIVGYRYTAPYTGTVNIDPGELVGKMYGRTWGTNVGFAIYVDGVRVWPTNAEVADTENTAVNADGWYTLIHDKNETTPYTDEDSYLPAAELALAREAMTGIKVAKGAQIEFLMIGYGDNKWSNAGEIYKDPSVTFTEADLPKTLVTTMSADIDIKTPTVSSVIENSSVMSFDLFKAAHEEITDDAEQRAAYKEYLLTALKVTYNGAWSQGIVKANGSYVKIGYWFAMPDLTLTTTAWDVQWYIAEDQINARLDSFVAGNKPAGIWSDEIGLAKNLHKATTIYVPSSANTVYADVFTASSTGNATFSFNKLNAADANRYAIAIDGVVIWPAGATMDDKSAWYGANSETMTVEAINAALAELDPVKVLRGSNIQFCSVRTNGAAGAEMDPVVTMEILSGMDHVVIYCDGNNNPVEKFNVPDGQPLPQPQNKYLCDGFDLDGDGEVDELPETVTEDLRLVPINDYSTPDIFYDHRATLNEEGTSTGIVDNWSVVHGHWSADISIEPATWSFDHETGYLTKQFESHSILISEEASLWDATGGGMYSNGKFAVRKTESMIGMASVWTAPKTGRIAIDLKTLQSVREVNKSDPAGKCATYFAIVLNGKVVWPSDGTPYLYEGTTQYDVEVGATEDMLAAAKAHEAFPILTVCEGDEVAFVANQGNPTTWMFYMNPTVVYTDLLSAPELDTVAPILGADFALKFSVNGDAAADELGVIVNGTTYACEDGFAVIPGIAAKAMTDTIKVTPYAKFGESVLQGAEEDITFAAAVKALIAKEGTTDDVKNLAKATLNYGAAVQTYLNYYTTRLANDDVDAIAPAAQHTNVYDLTTELGADDELVVFETVSAILGEKLALKVVVINADSAFKLEVADNEDFTGSVKYELKHCALGSKSSEYKAIIAGVNAADFGDTLYIRVVDGDGEVMSETLTYSVVTYALRIADNGNANLANAILALYDNTPAN